MAEPMTNTGGLLSARNLCLKSGARAITETIKAREIVGLAGLDGHGQAAFLETLGGVRQAISGNVFAGNTPITSLQTASAAGLGYLPSDRKRHGIFPGLGVVDNFALGGMAQFSRRGWFRKKAALASLARFREELSMVYASWNMPIDSLSGGNQQKVLLARSMASDPKIMLLNDPTRGVDIGTRQVIYRYFRKAVAERGIALVILSTELEEIIELCDRVIIFRNHEASVRMPRNKMTMDNLMAAMFGHGAPSRP